MTASPNDKDGGGKVQFGDMVLHRGKDARVIEVCTHPKYPAITVQWDTEEVRDGKKVLFRQQETIPTCNPMMPALKQMAGGLHG